MREGMRNRKFPWSGLDLPSFPFPFSWSHFSSCSVYLVKRGRGKEEGEMGNEEISWQLRAPEL
jgi:hypothetical protein